MRNDSSFNNSIQFNSIYLGADITVQRPVTKRVREEKKTYTYKKKKIKALTQKRKVNYIHL
jgi:hypothetical protein